MAGPRHRGGRRWRKVWNAFAVSLVDSLRSCGCTLPIEIFYLGSHELKCSTMKSLAARERCTLRDLLAGQPTLRDVQGFGYAAKPLALAASSFAEVLLLDADIIALRDPSFLFDEVSYLTHGAVFWSDMYAANETFVRLYDPRDVRLRPSMLERAVQDALDAWLVKPVRMKPDFVPALSTIGLPPDAPTHESGQVLMDKRRCVDALAAAGLLNLEHAPSACVRWAPRRQGHLPDGVRRNEHRLPPRPAPPCVGWPRRQHHRRLPGHLLYPAGSEPFGCAAVSPLLRPPSEQRR